MKLVDRLEAEHLVFLQQLDVLEQLLRSSAAPDLLERILGCVAAISAPLLHHAQCEEEILFPQMVPHLGDTGGPIQVMKDEHELLHHELKVLGETPPDAGKADTIVRAARSFLDILREHIAKEDGVLFPMARSFLPEELLEELDETCPARRGRPTDRAAARQGATPRSSPCCAHRDAVTPPAHPPARS